MDITKKLEISRRMCPVIFLLDTSGSMSGAPIGAVNAAMESVLPELISMNDKNPDNEIQIAVMTFDFGVTLVTGEGGLVAPENYSWNDLNADGGTAMGAAFRELNKILSAKTGFMKHATGSVAPVLFLLSDGEPTDDYQEGLQLLKQNNWYKFAARVAIGYGDSNDDVLREFTGNVETVLHTNDPKDLTKMIKFVTITSSMVASTGVAAQSNKDATTTVGDILTSETVPGGQLSGTDDPDDFD